jgi:ketosteroid isomerase-like protein
MLLRNRSILLDDFDQIAIVVDWLDACRARDLNALLELYAQDASLECTCDGPRIHQGRAELESYWRPRLDDFSPTAFGLDDITPASGGVVLDYISAEDRPVRIFFAFDENGKILQTRCERAAATPRR